MRTAVVDAKVATTRRILRQASLEPRTSSTPVMLDHEALTMTGWTDAQHDAVRQWAIGQAPRPAFLQ